MGSLVIKTYHQIVFNKRDQTFLNHVFYSYKIKFLNYYHDHIADIANIFKAIFAFFVLNNLQGKLNILDLIYFYFI